MRFLMAILGTLLALPTWALADKPSDPGCDRSNAPAKSEHDEDDLRGHDEEEDPRNRDDREKPLP